MLNTLEKNISNGKFSSVLILDKTTWQFRLKSKTNEIDDRNCIKELPSTESTHSDTSTSHQCCISDCKLWVNGICVEHPIIFVKEVRPTKLIYSAMDTVPEFLYIASSTIPDAGLGVFTSILLPAGVAFGPYLGSITRSLNNAPLNGYAWKLDYEDGEDYWVDGGNVEFSNWMRYVNCARWKEEQNMVSRICKNKVYYHTYKPVLPGSELMIRYGYSYAKVLNISVDCVRDFYESLFAPKKTDS